MRGRVPSSRRHFLSSCLTLALARAARADGPSARGAASKPVESGAGGDLRLLDLRLEGDRGLARRALVLSPAHGPAGQTYPGLLLMHGRGEAVDELTAIHAWRARYGLVESYARLLRAPVALTPEQAAFMRPSQLTALNAGLAEKPFGGLVLICPVTPNTRSRGRPERALERYSDWIEQILLPAVRARAPLAGGSCVGIDGCSMGGYVAAEVYVRKPDLFRTFGVVQPAVGAFRCERYARHLARGLLGATLRGIHLQTSTEDPYRRATEALSAHLERLGARHTLNILPGPHNQRWLRATGTLAMLAWHGRTSS